ncbi:flavodoxin [Clostridium sp. WILCCON 0269]|uniref:Flavodoxin n=1 Tax=Candidatus Clostridium eludens TaxID=3381663 RepID=A0ABW8SJH8_9CLOT
MNKKIFIIYYSWSSNTGNIARLIQQETGGQLFEVNPVQAYPSNYGTCVEQAKKEIHSGFMPELEAIPDNLDSYDVIFIGTPIWWHTMAPPVFTFLSHADMSGKTVVPFCTHGGGGKGHYINDISKLCKNSIVLDELVVYGDGGKSAELDVQAWLNRIGDNL